MARVLSILVVCFVSSLVVAQTTPVEGLRDKTPDVFALVGATVTTAPGHTIDSATILVRDHRIVAVGAHLAVPGDAVAIDARGLFIYPGFIEPYSDYGMPAEKPAPPTSDDFPTPTIDRNGALSWNGAVHAERDAAQLFKPDDKRAEKLRANGFALAQVSSLDGIFRGTSCVVTLGAGLPNDCIVNGAATQFCSFDKGSSKQDYPSSLMGAIALIRQTFYDAQWYRDAQAAWTLNPAQDRPERNDALAALAPVVDKTQTVVFDAGSVYNMLRAKKIADEFGLHFIIKGAGWGFRRLDAVKAMRTPIIMPVAFPPAPDVSSAEAEAQVSFDELKAWDEAPDNPGRLARAGITFAFTEQGLKKPEDFLANVRTAVRRGLPEDSALAALTTTPAQLCGISNVAGTIDAGKAADFVVSSGPIFASKTKIYSVWIDGKRYDVNPEPEMEPRGTWNASLVDGANKYALSLDASGDAMTPAVTVKSDTKSVKAEHVDVTHRLLSFSFDGDSVGMAGDVRLSGTVTGDSIVGFGAAADGGRVYWSAVRLLPYFPKPDTSGDTALPQALFPVTYPDEAFGLPAPPAQPRHVAMTNATVWTVGPQATIEHGTVLFGDGKIIAVGPHVDVPSDAIVIDGTGKDVTPGIIDEHSHIGIDGDVNEGTQAISAEVRIGDVVNPDDINLYRQLAGGTTISHLLHGSANPIGGQCQVVKHRWGALPDDMKMTEAPPSIKFALGENVKESNWGDHFNSRYPQSRMGVDEIMRDEFQTALEYEHKWDDWKAHPSKDRVPPRRDLELDAIVEILNGKRFITVHSYVQSEILSLMKLADDFHFRVRTFTHILEGYKLAPEMREHGAMASTFADWWDYKFEVYDAIPYNAAMLEQEGIVTDVNSDDAEMGRRLNQEAAKTIKYGGLPDTEAIKLCTLNGAKNLMIDKYVGSLEPGKDADVVLWDGNPLSAHSKPLQTWVDGKKYFDRDDDARMQQEIRTERAALIARAAEAKGGSSKKNAKGKMR